MYSLYYSILLIVIINLETNKTCLKLKASSRIGPHNKDILCVIFGSLLGNAHAEKRALGFGTRISFYQEDSHLEYITFLHKILKTTGYCNEKLPIAKPRLGLGGKVRKCIRFHT